LLVGYCRVSTKSADQTASIQTQAQRLTEAGCGRVLIDHGISGFRESGRKGSTFPELIDLILGGEATQVVVPNFDRTQRRAKWGAQLLDAIEQAGITLLELDTKKVIDPANDPSDVMMLQLRTIFQENDSRWKRIKVRQGLAKRREAGFHASGKVPFGYAHINGRVVPSPEHWEAARVMFLQLQGMDFNVGGWIRATGMPWTPRGVKAWLVNPTLRGQVNRRPGVTCEALINAQEWDDVKRHLSARAMARGVRADRVHLFTGLVKCESCGKSLHNCMSRGVKRLKCMAPHCQWYGRGIAEQLVRDRVVDALTAAATAMADYVVTRKDAEPPEAVEIRQKVEQLEALAAGGVDGLQKAIGDQMARLRELTAEREVPRWSQLAELFSDRTILEGATDAELRLMVIEYVASIVYQGGPSSFSIALR
jgi:DNA invertase Pin-like site-specific DNA recombinase